MRALILISIMAISASIFSCKDSNNPQVIEQDLTSKTQDVDLIKAEVKTNDIKNAIHGSNINDNVEINDEKIETKSNRKLLVKEKKAVNEKIQSLTSQIRLEIDKRNSLSEQLRSDKNNQAILNKRSILVKNINQLIKERKELINKRNGINTAIKNIGS